MRSFIEQGCLAVGVEGSDLSMRALRAEWATIPEFLFTATDFNSYVTVSLAEGAPRRVNGRMAASTAPGLGVSPRREVLGEPVAVVE